MAEQKTKKPKNPLVGAQAVPTILDNNTKIGVDTSKALIDNIIDTGLHGGLDIASLENFTALSNSRDQIYQLIDTMAADSTVSQIISTFAAEVCETSDNGHVVWCESTDPNVGKFVNYLLNVINVDKHIYGWVYCLIKYGDVYLKLYRESDYDDPIFNKTKVAAADSQRTILHESAEAEQILDEQVNLNIHSGNDSYSYYVEMVDDPSTMFELTKYGKTYGYVEVPIMDETNLNNILQSYSVTASQPMVNYKMRSNDVNIYQADDFVHAYLEDNNTRFPEKVDIFLTQKDYDAGVNSSCYKVRRGKSVLYDSYKTWREKSLLEDSAILNRVTRSSVFRNIQVEVGDMPKNKVREVLRRVKELFEQKSSMDVTKGSGSMSEYTNPGPIENNIFTATHNGHGAITVGQVGGDVDVKGLADLEWWNNKFYSNYGIPKQFFGWTEDSTGFNGGTSLAIISSVFAKKVKYIKNAILQAITDMINLMLLNKGCRSYINNFTLKMRTQVTQEEKDYREDFTNRINAISNLQSLFSDVESKARRLEILKSVVGQLGLGDEVMEQLDGEIKEAKEKAKAEAEAAEQAAAAEAAEAAGGSEAGGESGGESATPALPSGGEESAASSGEGEGMETLDLENIDLGNSSEVPMESFSSGAGSMVLNEDSFLVEDESLPSPEDLGMDMTNNDK